MTTPIEVTKDDGAARSGYAVKIRDFVIWVAVSVGLASFGASCLLGWLTWKHQSFAAGVARFCGRDLLMTPSTFEFGTCREGETRECQFELRNLSDAPVKLLGLRTTCGCMVVQRSFPCELPGRASFVLPVSISLVGAVDEVRHSVHLFTDRPGEEIIPATIHAHVRPTVPSAKVGALP